MKTSFLWLLEYVILNLLYESLFIVCICRKLLGTEFAKHLVKIDHYLLRSGKVLFVYLDSFLCISLTINWCFLVVQFILLWYKIAPLAPNVHCHPRPYIISNFILISVRRHFTRNIWCLQNKGQTLIYNPHFPTLMSGATSLNFRKNLNSRINSTSFIIKHQAPRPRMLNFTEVE